MHHDHDHDILSAASSEAAAKIRTAAQLREGDLLHRFLRAEWRDGRCRDLEDWLDEVRRLISVARVTHAADAGALDRIAAAFDDAGRFVSELRLIALTSDA